MATINSQYYALLSCSAHTFLALVKNLNTAVKIKKGTINGYTKIYNAKLRTNSSRLSVILRAAYSTHPSNVNTNMDKNRNVSVFT